MKTLKDLFFDPAIINYVIMCLYLVNCVRWTCAKNGQQVLYWACAFGITLATTWAVWKERSGS